MKRIFNDIEIHAPGASSLIVESATANGLEPEYLAALIASEFDPKNPDGYISPTGAIGIGQVSPGAALDVGIDPNALKDRRANIEAAARYLKKQIEKAGNLKGGIIKYKGISDPEKPENRRILNTYFRWVSKFMDSNIASETGNNPAGLPNSENVKNTDAEIESELSGKTGGVSLLDKIKEPAFLILVLTVLFLSVSALSEISLKSALEPIRA